MKKSLVFLLVLTLLASVSLPGFAADSASNPVTSQVVGPTTAVPHDSWDYNAVLKLYNDGITGGYSDAMFSGGKVFTRFDMAKFIHNAQQYVQQNASKVNSTDITLINKLATAYTGELKTLGVQAAQLKDVSQTSALLEIVNSAYWMPKFSFEAEVQLDTHFSQNPASAVGSTDTPAYPVQFAPDVYLQMQLNGRISPTWYYYGEIRFDPGNVSGYTNGGLNSEGCVYLRQLEAFGNLYGETTYAGGTPAGGQPNQNYFGQAFGVTGYIGRMADQLPFNDNTGNQGIVLDNRMNGVRFALSGNKWTGDIFAGYEDSSFANYSGYYKTTGGSTTEYIPDAAFLTGFDVGYSLCDDTQLYGGYYQFWPYAGNDSVNGQTTIPTNPFQYGNPLQFIEVGWEQALNDKIQLAVYASASTNYSINTNATMPTGTTQISQANMYTPNWVDNTGVLARLSYGGFDQTKQGSVGVYGQGSYIGAGATWGGDFTNAANYDNEVYQPNRVLGAQGYEIGVDWAPIHNTDFHFSFSQTFPMHTPVAGSLLPAYTNDATAAYNVAKCELNYYF
ncbi:MAG: S-layer homology domain-containing protein [Negativicutes bacterium]|jgi:hypothetical protein